MYIYIYIHPCGYCTSYNLLPSQEVRSSIGVPPDRRCESPNCFVPGHPAFSQGGFSASISATCPAAQGLPLVSKK